MIYFLVFLFICSLVVNGYLLYFYLATKYPDKIRQNSVAIIVVNLLIWLRDKICQSNVPVYDFRWRKDEIFEFPLAPTRNASGKFECQVDIRISFPHPEKPSRFMIGDVVRFIIYHEYAIVQIVPVLPSLKRLPSNLVHSFCGTDIVILENGDLLGMVNDGFGNRLGQEGIAIFTKNKSIKNEKGEKQDKVVMKVRCD